VRSLAFSQSLGGINGFNSLSVIFSYPWQFLIC
jgi:hypothetical protein